MQPSVSKIPPPRHHPVTTDRAGDAALSGERKLVTLVFADLSGFTALASSLDPEEVYAFVRPGMAALQGIVEDHGGTVPQVMGDGFMAIFGVPTAHEDDAERAVRAVLAVREHARELRRNATGIPFPEVHAGVNSGEVMVAPSNEPAGFAVVGDTVNIASRLADLAGPGVVLVDEQTKRRTDHAIRYGPTRPYRVKGKATPIAAFEALGVHSTVPAGRPTPAVSGGFVDRERELEALGQALGNAVHNGRSNVLVVTAEPGAGKTRLAAEFAKRRPDVILLTGRCTAYGRRLPLSPIAGALQELIGLPEEAPKTVADQQVRRFADRVAGSRRGRQLTHGLNLLLGTAAPHLVRHQEGAVGQAELAARKVFEGLAREAPVIAVLDDLHWADAHLLQLLHRTRANPWSGPVLFLGLSRTQALGAGDPLPTFELQALPEQRMRDLGRLALGPGVPASVLRRIAARASGNPLFLEESLSMLVESGALVQRAGAWMVANPQVLDRVPATIRTLIAARLDGLPPDEKKVLQHAAVCGEASWDRLLDSVSEAGDVRSALRRLVQRDLLRRRIRSRLPEAKEYLFKHVLIRDVAYESLPRRDRSSLHLQVATWLREVSGLQEEPVAELAYHYEQAWQLSVTRAAKTADRGLASLAADYLGRWADVMLTYQPRLAEALYRRAIDVTKESAGEVDPQLVTRLSLGRAESLIELGRHREAADSADLARSLASHAGDEHLQARALLTSGRLESDVGDAVVARRLLNQALASFEAVGDVGGQAWAKHRLSEAWSQEDYRRELEHLREAYRLFDRAGDRWGRVVAAQDLAYVLTTVGGEEFNHWHRQARRLIEAESDLRSRADILRTWGFFSYFCGAYREAIRTMREARPIAVEAGHRYAEADTLLIEAMAASFVASPKEAERLAAEAVRLGRGIDSVRIVGLGLAVGARAHLRAGDPSRATRQLSAARKTLRGRAAGKEMLEVDFVDAGIQLDRGNWQRVAGPAGRGAAGVRASGWALYGSMEALLVGRALLGAGQVDEASAELERAVESAQATGAVGTFALAAAVLDQALIMTRRPPAGRPQEGAMETEVEAIVAENDGLLALFEGRTEVATAAFALAVERWQQLGLTVWLGRALSLQAEALRRSGGHRRAARLDSRATNVMDRIKTPARHRPGILSPIS
jgi:class 3 adenylate cyclase/tetratricopeptide (TPR) repeat protein